jgi:WD40 repeat protein
VSSFLSAVGRKFVGFGFAALCLVPAAAFAVEKPQLVLPTGYGLDAGDLAFSPDGRLLGVMNRGGGAIRLWDLQTARALRVLNIGPRLPIPGGRFLFTPSGDRLVSESDGYVKTWDVNTGRELHGFILPKQQFAGATFSRDGKWIATASGPGSLPGSVTIWDVATGSQISSALAASEGDNKRISLNISSGAVATTSRAAGAPALALSPDGRFLATWDGRPRVTISQEKTPDVGPSLASIVGDSTIRILDIGTGREERRLSLGEDSSRAVTSIAERQIAFSPNGRWLAAMVRDETSVMIPTPSPTILKMTPSALVDAVIGQHQEMEGRIQIWDLSSGRQIARWKTTRQIPTGMSPDLWSEQGLSFAADSTLLVAAVSEDTIVWFTLPTGALGGRWKVASKAASIATGPSNDLLAVSEGREVALRDLRSGRPLRVLNTDGPVHAASDIAFDRSGRELRTTGNKSLNTWDFGSGTVRRSLELSKTTFISSDGGSVAAAEQSSLQVWNATTGLRISRIEFPAQHQMRSGAFSPDAQLLALSFGAEDDRGWVERSHRRFTARAALESALVDRAIVRSGQQGAIIPGSSSGGANRTRISLWPQFDLKLTQGIDALTQMETQDRYGGSRPPEIQLFDVATGRLVHTLVGDREWPVVGFGVLAFSPDGSVLAAASAGYTGRIGLWDLKSQRELPSLKDYDGPEPLDRRVPLFLIFSQDGRTLIAAHMSIFSDNPATFISGTLSLWDLASAREARRIACGHGQITALSVSPDGRRLGVGSEDGSVVVFDFETGKEVNGFRNLGGRVHKLAFSPTGRLLASAGDDGEIGLWDAQTNDPVATLVSLNDGADWLAVTPEGLFDGSPTAWNQILWRFSANTFDVSPVEAFFNEFFYPGLLAEAAAGKRPIPAQELSQKDRRQPHVRISLASGRSPVGSRTATVRLSITDAPAGAQDLRLFRNGSLVKVWHDDLLNRQGSNTLEVAVPLVVGDNRLSAYAFNRDNIKSSDATLVVQRNGAAEHRGTAYILTIGIDRYANSDYNLRYAVADAADFGEEVRRQQEQLGRYDRVELLPLFNENATKAGILSAFDRLAAIAQPEDTVFLYYAGHGTARGSRFYIVPHDLGHQGSRTELTAAAVENILEHSISDIDLVRAFESMDAGRAVLIIDACNAGQALEADEKRLGPMNSKGLAQLAYEKGMYILTAAQGYQAALETAQLGHGYLTYALIEEGLKMNAADFEPRDGVVLGREWLDYAAMRVPDLQLEKVRQSRLLVQALRAEAAESERGVQRPRLFYRREIEDQPLVIARPR